jgi:hypothetical protein
MPRYGPISEGWAPLWDNGAAQGLDTRAVRAPWPCPVLLSRPVLDSRGERATRIYLPRLLPPVVRALFRHWHWSTPVALQRLARLRGAYRDETLAFLVSAGDDPLIAAVHALEAAVHDPENWPVPVYP